MTLVEDTGECFIRSMDDAERDRHVVAYWRFEDRPVGTLLPHTAEQHEPVCATVDSSFNGNDLYTYSRMTQPIFSAGVAAAAVPQTGSPNRSCLDTSQPDPPDRAREERLHPFPVQPRRAAGHPADHAAPVDDRGLGQGGETPRQGAGVPRPRRELHRQRPRGPRRG